MSVHFWGEDPRGSWTLSVTDNAHNNRQHHRYKTRFGDTEDATQILQDEINGQQQSSKDEFKTTEDFQDNIFKDSSFKTKSKHDSSSNDVERVREKNEKIKHQNRIKNKTSNKTKPSNDEKNDENEAEVKILEELLGAKQTHDTPKQSHGILNKSESLHNVNQSVTSSYDHHLNNMTIQDIETKENSSSFKDSTEVSGDSETKMLESLLRGVISQVFSNFLQSNSEGSKSFEQRLSMLESLLGKQPQGEDDKVISGLMDAFKSGKAIDRVNNVLTILEDNKNNTKFTNNSFSRNANVVVDVLKVLKDILNTEKGDKNLKDYKERVSNLLEHQSGNTEKMTKKLLSDLKVSGTDSSDIVNDALILIRRIFQSEKKKTENTNKNHRKKSHQPQHQQQIESQFQKEITKSKQTKEIQHSDDDVEKITVERVKVKNPKQYSPQKFKKVFQSPLFEEDTNSKRTTFNGINSSDFFNEQEKEEEEEEEEEKRKNDFTLTITKNGQKISERKVNDVQALTLFQQPTSSYDVTTKGEKKQAISGEEGKNIDVEIIMDGDVTARNRNIQKKEKQTENNKQMKKTNHHKVIKERKFKKPAQEKQTKLKTKITSKSEEENDEEPIFPFLPFNENGGENFFPSSLTNNFEYPFIPSYDEQATVEEFHQMDGFEQPVKNPMFNIDKRSRLINREEEVRPSFFPYFSFITRPEVPLNRRYRSNDDDEKVRQKRADTDEEEEDEEDNDMIYKHGSSENEKHSNRRSVENEYELIRDKRTDDDEPHVVKRSAILSDFYSSPSPVTIQRNNEQVMTNSEKRSAIRKALSLEKALRKKLDSSKEENNSESTFDVLKRVHSDIANGDAKDLRVLEKELSRMKPEDTKKELHDEDNEPINNFIKLVEQTENSAARKNIPDEAGKQTPEEYYKYGTSSSGILVSWTMKFYGT